MIINSDFSIQYIYSIIFMASSINLQAQHIKRGICGSPNKKRYWDQSRGDATESAITPVSIGHEQFCPPAAGESDSY